MPDQLSSFTTAIETSAIQIFEEMGLPYSSLPQNISLVGKLLAAKAYCQGINIASLNKERYVENLKRLLKYTYLRLSIDTLGKMTTSSEVIFPSFHQMICLCPPDSGEPLEVNNDNKGNTYYIIQNLNIYLTADVVQQLNVNPQQVINQLHEQIREEIGKIKKQV